jgi:hypothetical protein
MNAIHSDLLSLLVCPMTHAPLVEHEGWLYSTDSGTRLKYPIRDGIPILLVEEGQDAGPDEFERIVSAHGRPPASTQNFQER